MSTLEATWEQLVREKKLAGGYVRLRIPEIAGCAFYAARRVHDGLEALIVEIRTDALPGDVELPQSKGFRVVPSVLEPGRAGRTRLVLELVDPRYSDVFRSLADDLVRRIALAPDDPAAVRVLVAQLSKWQAFLRVAGSEGLSVEAQRGLVGELTLLRDCLLDRFGDAAVACWTGSAATNHDFQLPGGHLEVKSTVASTPHIFHVSNAGQLDSSSCGELFLCLTGLAESQTIGESLSEIAGSVRSRLGNVALADFDDKLLPLGIIPGDGRQYSAPRYGVRSRTLYQVRAGFPRLIPTALPAGVEDVSYTVVVAACEPFRVDLETGLDAISVQERAARE
jgi:hypothetical protein